MILTLILLWIFVGFVSTWFLNLYFIKYKRRPFIEYKEEWSHFIIFGPLSFAGLLFHIIVDFIESGFRRFGG